MDTSVEIAGIRLKNPVIAASGTFGYGLEFAHLLDLNALGGFVVKGLSREPMPGNPAPRIVETAAGMLNAIGLQNVGVEAFIREKLPELRKYSTAVFANIFGNSTEDYVTVAERLESAEGLAGYEINVSCPNTKRGGMMFGADPALTSEVTSAVRRVARRPVIVKLSPNVTDIAVMARAAEEAGADAISLVNTFVGMSVDLDTRRPALPNVTGGLSGPAIKPIAVRMVYQAAGAVKIPVIGMGGIANGRDALEFMIAGAAAVEVGTTTFWDPLAAPRIVKEMETWCRAHGVEQMRSLTKSLQTEGR
jgi:dihydroorotate dehydrogenase (NAD+) catalytic subunit